MTRLIGQYFSLRNSSMSELSVELVQEQVWIEQSRSDTSEFKPLYEKYYEPLFRYFLRRTDDEDLAADLCSTTFYKALDNLNKFVWQGKPFGAWLFKIAGNELRKYFRDQKPIYVIEEDKLNCMAGLDELPEDYQMDKLIKVLDDLPEQELRLLELKYFEAASFREMSDMLSMGESAVKMRLYRLLTKLKTLILHEHD